MWNRRLLAACAACCWLGSAAIIAAEFAGECDSFAWAGVRIFLLGVGAVLVLARIVDLYVVAPRTAYRLGQEAERRQQGLRQHAEPFPFRQRAAVNGRRTTTIG